MRFNYWQKLKEDQFFHIYNRSVGKEYLFRNDADCDFFLQKWNQYLSPYLDTYAYCLMGNHFHFLVKIKNVDEEFLKSLQKEKTVAARKLLKTELKKEMDLNSFLVDQFKRLFTAYARKFNDLQKRHGSLFQTRFKRVRVEAGTAVLEKIAYIHHNPIHHGFHSVYHDWKYSSYDAYLGNQPTFLARKNGLELFGVLNGQRKRFTDYHHIFKQNWKKLNSKEDDM
jgi:putative transposase